jgi:thiosulfate/3-mercaptopyruvate sulfurtransferase
MNSISNVISCKELNKIITNKSIANLRIFDCTYPGNKFYNNFIYKRIPDSQFLDLDNLRDKESGLTLQFPKPITMKNVINDFNINKNDQIIFYDQFRIYSSPRAWFIFKAYGFPYVSVLNGGLPKWVSEGFPITSGEDKYSDIEQHKEPVVEPSLDYDKNMLIDYEGFKELIKNAKSDSHIIDSRPSFAFFMNSLPNTTNIQFGSFLNKDGTVKDKSELNALFEKNKVNPSNNIVSTCGIGLSACIPFLILTEYFGNENLKLYNGSFEEYSMKKNVQ